jgi:hypothetical protein
MGVMVCSLSPSRQGHPFLMASRKAVEHHLQSLATVGHYIVVFCIMIVLYLGQYDIPVSSLARTSVERSKLVYEPQWEMK